MTLDEAIKHAEEVMVENMEKTKCRNASDPIAINCFECAEEHRQLAEWLKELKRQREAWQAIRHDIIELKPDFGNWLIDGDSVKQAVCETVNEALIIIDKHLQEVI